MMNGLQDLCSRRICTAWQQLTYNGVVLVQLGVGVGVRLLRGGSTVELPLVAVPGSSLLNSKMPGIRHCSLILNKHMTNINGGDCKYNSR